MRIQQVKRYKDLESELEFTFRPVDDTLTIKKTDEGFEARYLVQDENAESPDAMSGGCSDLFLVNYHRDFDVRKDEILTMENVRDFYHGNLESLPDGFHYFKLSMLSHSGVHLALDSSLDHYYMGLDTSHVGLVLVSMSVWPEEEKALEAAKSLVTEWNQFLSGEVFGIVKETYDKEMNQLDCESVWGFYGFEYAKKALETDI